MKEEVLHHLRELRSLKFETAADLQRALLHYHTLYGIFSVLGDGELSSRLRDLEEEVRSNSAASDPSCLVRHALRVCEDIEASLLSEGTDASTFEDLARFAEAYAGSQGKRIFPLELHSSGETFPAELYPSVIHLIRNAIDHGIETPELRVEREKSLAGKITLDVKTDGDDLLLQVLDDGAGISSVALPQIFDVGFSSKSPQAHSTGRGLGLSAVKLAMKEKSGEVQISSEEGRGTTVSLRLPLPKV